jgi:endonuclease/exonuclease/phosphatase (EEP) superfamily protein YafD
VRAFKAGVAYFALVFGAGFVLGSVRVPFLVPRVGARVAELIEMPFMFVVVLLSARFVARRFALPASVAARLGAGLLALALLLVAEAVLVVALQGKALGEYIADRDPVSGGVYVAMLALFALMPLICVRWK